ncbi:hypothetical protein ACLOJK_023487 [Asimina triloba]
MAPPPALVPDPASRRHDQRTHQSVSNSASPLIRCLQQASSTLQQRPSPIFIQRKQPKHLPAENPSSFIPCRRNPRAAHRPTPAAANGQAPHSDIPIRSSTTDMPSPLFPNADPLDTHDQYHRPATISAVRPPPSSPTSASTPPDPTASGQRFQSSSASHPDSLPACPRAPSSSRPASHAPANHPSRHPPTRQIPSLPQQSRGQMGGDVGSS